MEKDKGQRLEYFKIINTLSHERLSNGLDKLDREAARNLFDSHLIYYNYNFNSPQIAQCFEEVHTYIGYCRKMVQQIYGCLTCMDTTMIKSNLHCIIF
eukprot:UN08025